MVPSVSDVHAQYEALLQRHDASLRRLCTLLLGDQHEAEDVMQEVGLKLWKECHLPHATMAWGAWLTRVAIHACRDRRRSGWWKWWRAQYTPLEEWHLPRQVPTPEEVLVRRETRQRIAQALQQLAPRQREVFVLCHLEEHSSTEAAALLGLTPGSVKQHLFRAIRHLRRALGELA